MWGLWLALFGRYRNRAGAEAARRALQTSHPGVDATEVWRVGREADRDVVAVLYKHRGALPTRGMPLYKLFVVRRDHSAEELFVDADSPYYIRGIK